MRRIFQKELDMILHWNLTLVGGFLGTYAILLHAGNFGSAQTGNVMEMAAALTGKNFAEVGIRFLAFLIFGSAIVISYLLTNFTKLDMRKLVLWVDAAGLTVTAMMPEGMSAVVSLYPIFFCSAFQWGSYSGASGYNSASIFTTNNFKQSLLAWTQFVLTKDPEFRRKGIMYTMTVLSFFVGACIGCVSVYTYGAYGAFIGFVHWKDTGREWYTGRNGRRSKRSTRRGKSAGERSETVIVLRRTSAVLRFYLQNTLNMQIKTCREINTGVVV